MNSRSFRKRLDRVEARIMEATGGGGGLIAFLDDGRMRNACVKGPDGALVWWRPPQGRKVGDLVDDGSNPIVRIVHFVGYGGDDCGDDDGDDHQDDDGDDDQDDDGDDDQDADGDDDQDADGDDDQDADGDDDGDDNGDDDCVGVGGDRELSTMWDPEGRLVWLTPPEGCKQGDPVEDSGGPDEDDDNE